MKIALSLLVLLGLWGCQKPPEHIAPVQNFSLERYLGTWYEIARLDHSFERGLNQVSAHYAMGENGSVQVRNRGLRGTSEWKEAQGRAVFARNPTEGFLKVSFFRPFYGAYVIFGLDSAYQHAYVCGSNTEYLWFLARTPTVSDSVRAHFVERSQSLGFDTTALIWVDQSVNLR